jgi:hypothetical protein
MLATFLKGASAAGGLPLEFVGGVALDEAATQTPSYSLTGLTGGLASSPSIGDIVIACVFFTNSTNRDIQCTTSGYTEIVDLYGNYSRDPQLGIYYKILTAADTSVAFDLGVSATSRFVCHVWRNIDSSTPLDATRATNTQSKQVPDCRPITTVTPNAVVIAVACLSNLSVPATGSLSVPSGMENFFSTVSNTVLNDGGLYIASAVVVSPGSYDPPVFGGSRSNIDGSLGATLALRPA